MHRFLIIIPAVLLFSSCSENKDKAEADNTAQNTTSGKSCSIEFNAQKMNATSCTVGFDSNNKKELNLTAEFANGYRLIIKVFSFEGVKKYEVKSDAEGNPLQILNISLSNESMKAEDGSGRSVALSSTDLSETDEYVDITKSNTKIAVHFAGTLFAVFEEDAAAFGFESATINGVFNFPAELIQQ